METVKESLPSVNTKNGLFRKLLEMGINNDLAKKTMSFWLFLESKNFKNICDKLCLGSQSDLRYACAEAEMVFAFLEPDQISTESSVPCPVTSTLLGPNISLVQIFQDRKKVKDEIRAFYDTVYGMTFKDTLEMDAGKNTDQEQDMHDSKKSIPGLHQPPMSTLNPFAKEWSPATEGPSLADRSLFITFSQGRPLSEWEIVNYFERNYGNCVEDVFVYMPRDGRAEFGKITFKVSCIPRLVLKDKEYEKFYIGGKTICLKKYKSR